MEPSTTNFHNRHKEPASSDLDLSDFALYWNEQQLSSSDLTTVPATANSLSTPNNHGSCNNSWSFRVSRNNELCNSTTSEQTNTVVYTVNLLASVYFPLTAYILPLMIALSTANNSLVLYVMLRSKRYKELTAKNVCCSLGTTDIKLYIVLHVFSIRELLNIKLTVFLY